VAAAAAAAAAAALPSAHSSSKCLPSLVPPQIHIEPFAIPAACDQRLLGPLAALCCDQVRVAVFQFYLFYFILFF